MYSTTTHKPFLNLQTPIRSTSHNAALIDRALVQLKEDVEEFDWKQSPTPKCQDSLIDYVQKEATDIVKAAAAGKSHMTKDEIWDMTVKLVHLAAICLEKNPFMVINQA